MKQLIIAFIVLMTVTQASAQYAEVTRDYNGSKTVKGFLNKEELVSDTAFIWFTNNQKNFKPEVATVEAMSTHKDAIRIIAFCGTWCDDTKQILPQFYATAAAAGIRDDQVTLIGVDRDKKTLHHLSETFQITNVPTFIVMKNGKEVGRVVEYGKKGLPMRELGEIIAATDK